MTGLKLSNGEFEGLCKRITRLASDKENTNTIQRCQVVLRYYTQASMSAQRILGDIGQIGVLEAHLNHYTKVVMDQVLQIRKDMEWEPKEQLA